LKNYKFVFPRKRKKEDIKEKKKKGKEKGQK